jgi:hypothetical protein
MRECPYCSEPLEPTQATCHNCKMAVSPKLQTPAELAAQTTRHLQKLLARSPVFSPKSKPNSFETRGRTLVT